MWLTFGDSSVCQLDELCAAAAHLNRDFPQRGSVELEARWLSMVRTNHMTELALGILLELMYAVRSRLEHEIILSHECF
jgi:hypothetical protein